MSEISQRVVFEEGVSVGDDADRVQLAAGAHDLAVTRIGRQLEPALAA
jgi:hypothetical protein